jgi:hypothetical protein
MSRLLEAAKKYKISTTALWHRRDAHRFCRKQARARKHQCNKASNNKLNIYCFVTVGVITYLKSSTLGRRSTLSRLSKGTSREFLRWSVALKGDLGENGDPTPAECST